MALVTSFSLRRCTSLACKPQAVKRVMTVISSNFWAFSAPSRHFASFHSSSSSSPGASSSNSGKNIVILGAGIGGVPAAYEVRQLLSPIHSVKVVSESEYFNFVPSNPWVGINWRKREDVSMKIGPYLQKKNIEFISSGVKKVLPKENALELNDGNKMSYDYLIIATGAKLAFDEVPGMGPNGYSHSICHIDHAMKSQAVWEDFCRNPGPIVIGAVQSASCYGPAYEYAFIIDADLRRRKIRHKVPMSFVTAEPYIGHLGLAGVGDSQHILSSALRDKHIKYITNARVTKFEANEVYVTEVDENGHEKKHHILPFKYSMFLPAFKGVDAVSSIDGLSNPRGFIVTDKHQRNPTFKNIYAVGVAVAIPPVEATPVPVGTPKTGYMIESMVAAAVKNIKADIDGQDIQHEATWSAVCLADFGDSGVAFVAVPQIPPRNINWFAEGKWVHLAKIGFEKYFMKKMKDGNTEPFYEKSILKMLGVSRLKTEEEK